MKAQRITMDDISKECGLSKMTVSRVLTGRGVVSAKTKALVLKACKRLKYEINTLASNLSSNRSGFIGIATPFEGLIGSNYFYEIIKGFQLVLKESAYDYALFDTLQDSFNDGIKLAKLFHQRKVDGLLVVAPHTNDHFLNTLADLRVPLVVVGENQPSKSICMVSCDDARGITLLCQHLISLGHRRIAYVGGPKDLSSARRREEAYVNFCHVKGMDIPEGFIQPGDYTMRSGRTAGLALLTSKPTPTAIIAANDLVAYGVMESARQLNLQIPHDISIAGFDDLPTASERCPSLTTIHQPICEMAQMGASLLQDALKAGLIPSGQTQMKVSLVVRESTAKRN
jgi:LacI family transcriptional regulator